MRERERGQCAVFRKSSPKFYNNVFLFVDITTQMPFEGLLIRWFTMFSVQKSQPLIVIYRRDNFVNYHWGFTSIYPPLSYPFRSLYCIYSLYHIAKSNNKIKFVKTYLNVTGCLCVCFYMCFSVLKISLTAEWRVEAKL